MSYESITDCDLQGLNLDQLVKLITYIDPVSEDFYIHFIDSDLDVCDLTPCAECDINLTIENLLKMSIALDEDGNPGIMVV